MKRKLLLAAEALLLLCAVGGLQACVEEHYPYRSGYSAYGYAPPPYYTHARPYVAPPPVYLYGSYDQHHVYRDRDWWIRNHREWVEHHHPDWLASRHRGHDHDRD